MYILLLESPCPLVRWSVTEKYCIVLANAYTMRTSSLMYDAVNEDEEEEEDKDNKDKDNKDKDNKDKDNKDKEDKEVEEEVEEEEEEEVEEEEFTAVPYWPLLSCENYTKKWPRAEPCVTESV